MLELLLMLVAEEDKDKLRYIYNTYHDDMLRLAEYKLRTYRADSISHDVQDVVQNAWYRITKYIDNIDTGNEKGSLKSYILMIVEHEAIRYIKNQRSVEPLDEAIEDEDFIEKLHIKERYNEVVAAITRLDAHYAIPLFLHYQQEIPVKELARLLGLPPKTVYTRLARGKKLLLKALGEEGTYE